MAQNFSGGDFHSEHRPSKSGQTEHAGIMTSLRTVLISVLTLSAVLTPRRSLLAQTTDLRTAVDQLAAQISERLGGTRAFRVAIADFVDLQGISNDLGRFVANRLTTRLVQSTRFSVVERQRLSQVLAELKFSMSDLVDPDKARQLGGMVGVEALIVGTISELGPEIDIDARVIEIETNQLLVGATITIPRDEVVDQMLNRGRLEAAPETEGVEERPGLAYNQTVSLGQLSFDLRSCERQGSRIACLFFVTNNNTQRANRVLRRENSYILDGDGVQYNLSAAVGQGPQRNVYGWQFQFPPQVAKRIELTFAVDGRPGNGNPVSIVLNWTREYVTFR